MFPLLRRQATLLALAVISSAGLLQAQTSRILNLSTRGQAGAGNNLMTSGFIVGSGAGDQILLRAVGPTLGASPFNIAGVLPDPVLTVYNSNNAQIATNSAWGNSPGVTASLMTSVGAFPLLTGSKDAAVLTSLPAGSYTATVTGASNDSGGAMLEIYEVNANTGSSRLVNLSTRLMVGTGANIATSGLVIGGGTGNRTLLIRAVGPTLGTLGVSGALADPTLTVLNSSSVSIASNNDWGTPVGAGAATQAQLNAAFAQSGAFQLTSGSKDAALITTLAPGSYTIQVSGNNATTGVALVEVYDITSSSNSSSATVSIAATQPNANTSGSAGVFTFTRTGDTSQSLTVNYAVGGTAVSGMDYQSLSGVVTIPAGSSSATVTVSPNTSLTAASTTVVLTISASTSYAIGTASDTVTITNIPPTLYFAQLNPEAGSTASGTATIYLAPNGSHASAQAAPHLTIGVPGSSSNFVFNLNYPGQIVNQVWTFTATGPYSSAQLLQALQGGNIYVEIGSQNYPTGELTGQFIQQQGSPVFTAPAPAPAIDLSTVSQTDAARFLTQATFGPTQADIASLMSLGYNQWISNQMALPETSHLAATRADASAFPNSGQYAITQNNRQAAWWKTVVNSPDQLRQRVAFALSEIFVVSDVASSLAQQPEALANYYDTLANDAFGNYRQLLQDVTLSPVMGNYLNMLRNAAAIPSKGTSADENYAREIMQLFSIGLNFLNPDGSLALDSSGQPIPTYTNTTIIQTANVFTGWSYHSTATNPSFTSAAADWYNPMQLFPTYHDNTQKTIIAETQTGSPVVIAANQGGAADLKAELDALFNHQNTGPFICRELIQRLVTSNPSPGYVYRVSQVFANDGTGNRGNLAAVVKAILLDYEARSSTVASDIGFGKLKEPILRQTAIYRAFNAKSAEGRFPIYSADQTLGQAALRSPTVFNFFLPDFVQPGTIAAAGLYAPEFQITTASTAIVVPNTLYTSIYTSATPAASQVVLDLSALTSAADNPTMVNTLNLLLCGNSLPTAATQRILTALSALPTSSKPLDRAQAALELVVSTQSGAVQQ